MVRVILNADPASPWWNGAPKSFLKVLGLLAADPHALLVMRSARDGLRLRLAMPWRGKAVGLGQLLFAADPASELWSHVPPKTLASVQGLWRDQSLWLDFVADVLGRWDDAVRQEYLDELAEVERDLGFSLRDGLLKHFTQGAALAIHARGKEGQDAISGSLDWLAVAPATKTAEVIKMFRKAVLKNGGAWKKEKEMGQPVSIWRAGEEDRAAFAEKTAGLIAGSSLQAVAEAAQNWPTEINTPVPPNFRAAFMLQANLKEIGAWLRRTRPAPEAEPARSDIVTQLLAEHGGEFRLATGRAGEGVCVLLDWEGPALDRFSHALLPVLAGMRMEAKRESSLMNVRQLGRAIVMYADKNKGRAPAQWADLAGEYIVSGKYFLSPKREDREDHPKLAAERCAYHLIFPGHELENSIRICHSSMRSLVLTKKARWSATSMGVLSTSNYNRWKHYLPKRVKQAENHSSGLNSNSLPHGQAGGIYLTEHSEWSREKLGCHRSRC